MGNPLNNLWLSKALTKSKYVLELGASMGQRDEQTDGHGAIRNAAFYREKGTSSLFLLKVKGTTFGIPKNTYTFSF